MKYILFYFSGTGNTKLITEELKAQLEKNSQEVCIYSVEELTDTTILDLTDTIVGIGFPVYKFTYPRIMEKLIQILDSSQLNNSQVKHPFFAYSTYCRFIGSSLHDMAVAVEKVGFSLIAKQGFKCPSNGIASMQETNDFEYETVMYFENCIDLRINNFAQTIMTNTNAFMNSGKTEKHHGKILDKFKIRVVGAIEKSRYPKLQINHVKCALCNICVEGCPENNLLLKNGRVEVVNEEDCMHCLKCMHKCRAHSITFGELTAGPNRYTSQVRRELYERATKTPLYKPERGTNEIKRQWALKNIKNWLFSYLK